MKNGICLIATAALRLHPDHKSEMVSQVLFGETFFVLESTTDWHHVEMLDDHYQGWIAKNQATLLDDESYEQLESAGKQYSGNLLASIWEKESDEKFLISGGSTLYQNNKEMRTGNKTFVFEGDILIPGKAGKKDITQNAKQFLHTPYLWGGRSAFGFDCSGFVQVVYKMAGLSLPRDAYVQANQGKPVHLIDEAMPGDLVFFDDAGEVINHVGILLGDGLVIHAHGKVRIDKIDHHGIFNTATGRYSHPLRLIKRILH